MYRRIVSLLVLCLLAAAPAWADRIQLGNLVRRIDPRTPVRTAQQNWRDGRFFATDNSVHPSPWAAIKRSVFPIDVKANVNAAIKARFHWTRLIGAVIAPASIELQREITSGEGVSLKKMVAAIDPKVMATTMAGGMIGEVGGAMVQSTLAKFGPVGAVAGFVLRPLISFWGSMTGYNVGKNLGKGVRSAIAGGFREIEPGRDLGQVAGYTFGSVVGQALIPIPVLGAIIGGTIGSLIGGTIGNWLGKHGPLAGLNSWMKRGLNALADWIEGTKAVATTPRGAAGLAVPHGATVQTHEPDGAMSLLGVAAQH